MSKVPRGLKCPECGSTKIWAAGVRPTRKRGPVQLYKCSNCAKVFTHEKTSR